MKQKKHWKHPKRMMTKAEREKDKQLTRKAVRELVGTSLVFIGLAITYIIMWLLVD